MKVFSFTLKIAGLQLPWASCLFVLLLVLTGCTSASTPVAWPVNHPANPQAREAPFKRSSNPFLRKPTPVKEKTSENAWGQPSSDSVKSSDHAPGSKMQHDHSQPEHEHQEHSP